MQCTQCNAEWKAVQSVTNCPFCQAILPVVKTYDPNSIEGKMIAIVTQFSPEIYKQPDKLNALILDLLNGEDVSGLLKVIIEKNASVECYKLKGLSGNELTINYNKAIDMVSSKTYIIKETITPAFNLLCIGLGLDVPTVVTQVQPSQPSQPVQPPQQVQNQNFSDFVINNTVLTKYRGAGGGVVIPKTVTSIGAGAFLNCRSLATIDIPNSVTEIRARVFFNCTNLISINIPNSVTSIGERAFIHCSNLTTINIPNSVTSIGERVFFNCTSLTTINIPNSVTSIGHNTFNNCYNLTTIDIPNSVTSIGNSAFSDCPKLSLKTIDKIKAINPNAY